MSYYRVVSPDGGENIMMKRDSHREIFDTSGILIDTRNLELPFKIKMFAGSESGYDQYDPDFEGEYEQPSIDERLTDYYSESSLMSSVLVESLLDIGIDNLQVFPVEIRDADSEEILEKPYFLVNIVGVIACAKLNSSEHSPIGSGYYFHQLEIDENRVNGQLIFRLSESQFEIIVHEKVAKIINSGEFKGITAELCS
jgi:hypothetical protein